MRGTGLPRGEGQCRPAQPQVQGRQGLAYLLRRKTRPQKGGSVCWGGLPKIRGPDLGVLKGVYYIGVDFSAPCLWKLPSGVEGSFKGGLGLIEGRFRVHRYKNSFSAVSIDLGSCLWPYCLGLIKGRFGVDKIIATMGRRLGEAD